MSVAVANNQTTSPSAWQLQKVVALAQSTIARLRDEDGLVIKTTPDALAALADEGVDAQAVLVRAVRAALDAKALGAAQDQRMADLAARRARSKAEEAAWRTTIAAMMEVILPVDKKGNRSLVDAEFTLTLAAGKPSVIITDDMLIPRRLIEVTTLRKPDKGAIRTALHAGEDVPGACLGNGNSTLTIRSK